MLFIKKDLKLSKKRKKNKHRNNSYLKPFVAASSVKSHQINKLAHQVFGSLYYSPFKD